MHQALKVSIPETHRVGVRTDWEDHRFFFGETFLHVDRDAIQVAKRGHGTDFTVWKSGNELRFMSQADLPGSQSSLYLVEIRPVGGGEDQCDHVVVSQDDDCLCDHLAGNVFTFRDLLGSKGLSMML